MRKPRKSELYAEIERLRALQDEAKGDWGIVWLTLGGCAALVAMAIAAMALR